MWGRPLDFSNSPNQRNDLVSDGLVLLARVSPFPTVFKEEPFLHNQTF